MANELVSVVIPTYNRAHCIEQTVDSVLAQTHQAVDIIIADDGSTDGTAELIKRRYGKESRVRYLYQPNAGVAAARNLGLGAARGEFIALLDSDDTWLPWKLELQLACFRALPKDVGMIWTDMEAIGPDGKSVSPTYLRTMYAAYRYFPEDKLFPNVTTLAEACPQVAAYAPGARLYWGDIFSPIVMGNLVHTSTTLMRRERFNHVKGFNASQYRICGEDYDYHLRTCREGPVAFINVSSIKYQIGLPDQITRPELEIHFARGFLATVTETLRKDRGRITLPANMISEVQAHAHRWLAVEYVQNGQNAAALKHIFFSLRHRFWQPKVWAFFFMTLMPPKLGRRLFETARAIKRRMLTVVG